MWLKTSFCVGNHSHPPFRGLIFLFLRAWVPSHCATALSRLCNDLQGVWGNLTRMKTFETFFKFPINWEYFWVFNFCQEVFGDFLGFSYFYLLMFVFSEKFLLVFEGFVLVTDTQTDRQTDRRTHARFSEPLKWVSSSSSKPNKTKQNHDEAWIRNISRSKSAISLFCEADANNARKAQNTITEKGALAVTSQNRGLWINSLAWRQRFS